MSECYVYWLRRPHENNVKTEGYIGITTNVSRRYKQHCKNTINPKLRNIFEKDGDIIQTHIIFSGNKEDCLIIEQQLRPANEIGWNLVKGSGAPPSQLGRKNPHSEETKRKMSVTRKLQGNFRTGIKHSNETIEKIKSSNKGQLRSQETIEKLRKAKIGHVPWNKGIKTGSRNKNKCQ